MKLLETTTILFLATFAAAPLSAGTEGETTPLGTSFWWGDVDGDGLPDAFVAHPQGANRMLLNRGDGGFDDVTARVGLEWLGPVREAHWQDYDVDGRADLLVIGTHGAVRLLRRGEGLRFVDAGATSGIDLSEGALSAHWIDFDENGLPDLLVAGPGRDRLWHNLGVSFAEVPLGLSAVVRPAVGPETPVDGGGAGGGPIAAGSGGPGYALNASPGNPLMIPCLPKIVDQAGGCLEASSDPQLGKLYPLSTDLNVTSTGRVGIGTTSPFDKLGIAGGISASGSIVAGGVFRSTASTGNIPLIVSSSTNCPNLSADLLDGLDSTDFSQLGNSIESSEITNGTITSFDLADDSVDSAKLADNSVGDTHVRATNPIQGFKIIPDFGSQDILTTGAIGVNVSNPKADLHLVGTSTSGSALICPNEPSSGDDAELTLGEDDNATYGMQLRYDGNLNELEVRGVNNGTETVHVAIERDSGDTAIGPTGQLARLTVNGTDDVSQPVVRLDGGDQHALLAESTDPTTATIEARNTGSFAWAIRAEGDGVGVYGRSMAFAGATYGVIGSTSSSVGYGVYSDGDFGGNGAKYFIQPHPADASKEIRFVCLEGNESGTYFRGSAKLVGGLATIDVPEEFRLVSEAEGLTVQTQPVGAPAALWVASRDLDHIVVRGNVDVDFDYFVNGVRRGWASHEPIRDNHAFVPQVRGQPYGTQYPDAYRQILVDNGILNADFTPNEATAAAQGWALRDVGLEQLESVLEPLPPIDR